MSRIILTDRIADFWEWFETHLPTVEAIIQNNNHPKFEWLIENLDQHILSMGKFKWQLDEPQDNYFSLVISPNSNRDLFAISQQIIDCSPPYEKWQFHASIPATGNTVFSVYNADMDSCTIDSQGWEMVLEQEDGQDYLLVLAKNLNHLDEDTRLVAVDLALTYRIGEALKITNLAGFDLVDEFAPNQQKTAFKIETLAQKLLSS